MLDNRRFWFIAAIVILVINILYLDFLLGKNAFLNEKLYDLQLQYNGYVSSRKIVTDLLLEKDVLNDAYVGKILYEQQRHPDQANRLRNELHDYLRSYYDFIRAKGYNVFHFHDSEGNSFLRFHKPESYGDSLLPWRHSIVKMIREQRPLFGVEIGRYHEEIRYIYPIFHDNTYVGSVEFSIKPYFLLNEMNRYLDGTYMLLLDRNAIREKVINEEIPRLYTDTPIEGYAVHRIDQEMASFDLTPISHKVGHKLIQGQEVATVDLHLFSDSYVYAFIPVSGIDGNQVGYIVAKKLGNHINRLVYITIGKFLVFMLLLLGGVFVYNRLLKQQRHSENILRQYKYAIDQSAIVSRTDAQGIINYVNDRFCEISGYTQEELIGKSHNIIRDPDNSRAFFTQMWKTIQSKNVWSGIIKNRKKNGSEYYVQSTITPILGDDGTIMEYIAIREDITEIIHSKNAIKEEKNLVNLIIEHLDTIFIVKQGHRIKYISGQFFKRFPFDSLPSFKERHHSVVELFCSPDGEPLFVESSDLSIQSLVGHFAKENLVHIRTRHDGIEPFIITIKKIPFETDYLYLIILTPEAKAAITTANGTPKPPAVPNDEQMLERIHTKLGLPETVMLSLLGKYREGTERSLTKLKQAISQRNFNDIEDIAHNIKGSSSTLFLETMTDAAKTLEADAKTQNEARLESLLTTLESAFAQFTAALERAHQ